MKSFTQFLQEAILNEKIINLGNRSATPTSGQVVIAAGGAGSGKGFVFDNILNIPNARTFDVDELKKKIMKTTSAQIQSDFEKTYGKKLSSLNLKNPQDVSDLHMFVDGKGWDKMEIAMFLKSHKDSSFLPNVIFDCTLKKISKLESLSTLVQNAGYDKKNIHLVWILNNFEVALEQNQKRERTVSPQIMLQTHAGASLSMKELISNFQTYARYIDGDIIIVPNQAGKDNKFTAFEKHYKPGEEPDKPKKLMRLDSYRIVRVKNAGGSCRSYEDVCKEIMDDVNKYVPEQGRW